MTWRLGTVAGIAVRVHVTFLLLLAFVAWQHWRDGQSAMAAMAGVLFVLALFACVVLHEFGHALTARRFGIATRDITLLPIGGVARLERMPEQPSQELWVALAGPAVNVVIAAVLYAGLTATSSLVPLAQTDVTEGPFLERLLFVNIGLVLFNLLPAFPMDGGRVLRAVLAMRLPYARATQLAATVGQVMAFGLGFLGLTGSPILLLIALFVWLGANQEATAVQMRSDLAGVPVSRAMMTDFRTVAPGDPLGHVVDLLLRGVQQDFPVVEGGRTVGIVLGADLPRALQAHGETGLVAAVMRGSVPIVAPDDMMEAAFRRLQAAGARVGAVHQDGTLVGLISLDNVGEFLMVQTSLARHLRQHRQA